MRERGREQEIRMAKRLCVVDRTTLQRMKIIEQQLWSHQNLNAC